MKLEPGFLFTDQMDHHFDDGAVYNIMFLVYQTSSDRYMAFEYFHLTDEFNYDCYSVEWFEQ